MGVFTQVGLLLWKNAKLKIRSPLLTVTTLLWPIVIFIIIAIIRTRLPPVPDKECHFKPQALPSVGTVDFMQSMMCDLKSDCLRADQVPKSNEPPTYGASIGLLLDDLEPLFSNESSIVNDLESLPDTLGPLINLTKTLEDTFNMINEQNIYLGDFFANRTKMQEILLEKFEGAEADLIEAMLAARINVLELLDVIGYSDSASLVCNAKALQTYVVFPPNTDVENIASALCKLKREDIENIINIVLEELDVHYIADEVTTFLRALDRYSLDNFTRDVLDIQEQLENITALGDFIDVLPQLIELTRLVPDIQRFFETIQGGNVDQTLYVLRRIVASVDWEGSPPWWSDVQELLFRITDIISSIFDMFLDVRYGDVTFKDLFGSGKVLQDVLRRFNVSGDSLVGLLNNTIQEHGISDFIFFLINRNATVEAYCRGEINLDDFLTSEVAVNESMLRNTLCKLGNGTSFLEALLNEYTAGRSITEIIQSLTGLFQPIGPGLDLRPLINETREIFQDIDLLPDFIKELPSILGALDSPQLAPLLSLATLNQSSLQEFLITMLVQGTTVVEGMFTQNGFWPIIQAQLAYQLVILDAQTAVINRVMGGALIDAFKDDPFTQVGELFLEFGPNITEAILSTFLDPSKIEQLVSMSPGDQQLVLCSDFIEYPPGLNVTYAKQELCKLNPAELYPSHVEVWASYFPEVVHAIELSHLVFSGNVSLIPPEILANATFKNVIQKQLEFQELLTTAFHTKIDLEDFFAGLTEDVSVTGSPDEWNAMLNRLTAKSLPALQQSVLIGEWESVLDYIGDIPEVHSFIAAEAMEDIIIQDVTIVLSIFNSLSRGEVPAYGGETEKLLRGIVFLTQQGNTIQATILEAYQDPVKALVLGNTDITQVLCNATLRNSLLDLTSVDIDVLDSSLCNLNYGLLINETVNLMQFEKLSYLFHYIQSGSNDSINLNLTAVAVHTNELVKTIQELDESWKNWIELVVNGSNWLSLAPQFTPQAWMDTWNTMLYMASFENLTAVFQEIDPRNLTILIEDLVKMTLPDSEVFLHKAAALEYAVVETMQGANNAFRLLQGISEGIIIPEFQGTETAKVLEALLEVDLIQLINAISDQEVIGVLSQVGYPQVFCNATIRDVLLDLPKKGIDTGLFDRTVCNTDWDIAAQELYVFVYGPQVAQWVTEFKRTSAPDQYVKPSDIHWDTQAVILELFLKNMANISGITEGLAEQLDIQGILAYYEKQWITDMIGVNPTNHTNWLDVLLQQLNMVWEQLDDSLADIPGWNQYRTNVYIILSAIEQIGSMNTTEGIQPFTLASIVPNATEFIIILREIPNLTDDIIYQLLYTPIDPVVLIELASSNSWNETLCNAELLSGFFVEPAGLNLTQLQGALCGIDFEALIGQLSQGAGIEHLISMIIDQIISFSGGDDFGIGDYDPAKWASRLEQLIKSFDVENIQGFIQSLTSEFLMIYEDIDTQLENVTGWIEFKADLNILLAILQYTTPILGNGTSGDVPISLSMLVPNATELELILAQNFPFNPEIIQAIIYTPINPTKLLELAVSNNWNATLCTEEGLTMLFDLPDGLNVTELQGVLCSVNFQYTLMELMQNGAIETIVSVIIDQLYLSIIPEFTLPGLDFSDLTDLIPQIFSMIQAGNLQNFGQYFESLNSLTAIFANETWYQDTIRQLQFMDFLTKTFTDKIIMLAGRTITFPNLDNLLANSSEFQRILLDDYQVGLGLVEALMTLSLQPDKLIPFFNMSNPLVTLCATGQFSTFFYSPLNPDLNITSLEEAVCKIDFEQLVMELKDLVSFDEILEQIQLLASTNPTGSYNWTAGYLTDERLSQAISNLVMNPPMLSFDEIWVNKTLETLIGLADRWNKAQERLVGTVPSDIASSFDGLAEILQQGVMANQSWAIEMASALRTMNALLDYTNNKLWAIPGRNITLHDLLPPAIATYIEANSDLTPDLIALLLQASVNTEALLAANGTWLEVVCSDAQNLPMMFQVPPDVDLDAAYQSLCSLDFDQWTVAYMQEIQNILIEVESGKEVNFTSITENFQKLASGIQALIENPPTLVKYNEEWFQSIIQRTGAILEATYNETQFLNPNDLPMLLNNMWIQIAASNPSLLMQARLNDYITQVLIDMLKMLPGQTYTLPRLDELFGDTTYVRELLSHSDIAPEIIDAFMSLAVDQDKIVYLINTPDAFVELCQSGQFSTFFQLPSESPTDITLVEEAVCTTNLTLVLAELDQKFKFTEIATQIERIVTNDPTLPPFNQTAASLRMMEFSNLIVTLIETPPMINVDLVWWENVYNRSEVIVLQWLQRLTDQALNGSSVPALDMVLAQLRTLDIAGFDADQFEMWIQQSRIQTLIAQLIEAPTANGTTGYIVPILLELFPEPDLIRELLNSTGLPEDVAEIFLQMIPQITKWLPMLSGPDPLRAVCDGGLFQDIFLLTNTSIDIQSIEDQICSLNLTDIDGLISQIFMSDFDALILELLQTFVQVPGLDPQTALNVSREISAIISHLISDPANFQLDPQSIINLLQSLQVPGLNQSWVQDWIKQVQLMQYINNVISDWLTVNNGTELAVPTFSDLFPDPSILVQLFTDLGVPTDITQAFLYSAIQADQWTQVWMNPDPLQAICNSSLFQDIFTQTINTSVDIRTIQDTLCSINLSSVDAILNDIFKTNRMIIQISLLLFNDPTMDWQTAWNTSLRFSQMFDELFQNPPVTDQDIKQVTLSVFKELEIMLRMYGVWDDTEHFLKYVEFYLQVIGHHLSNSNNFLKDLFDPTVSVDNLVSYVGMSPEEIKAALLGDITNIFFLADLYYTDGDWNYLFHCNNKTQFESDFNSNNDGFLNVFAVREVFCSLNISEFFETAKNLYGFDFLRLTELGYIRSRSTSSPDLDIESLIDLGTDIAQMISDLVNLPTILTQDLDLDFFEMRLANLSNAITAQDYEQLIVLLDELAPLLQSPEVVYQIKASLMSGSDIMSWFESIDSKDPVVWLERIEGALNETLLWYTILPALNFVDLLIEADVDSLNPLGYKYYDLITNETVLQQYLTEILGLAPEYAEAITLSGIKDVFVLADHHLSDTWESTYCITVDPANSTVLNLTAVYSLLCNLDREQFFESLNSLMGIDVLRLTQWIDDIKHPERRVVQQFDWQTLVDNIQSNIGMIEDLAKIGHVGGVNVTQVMILVQKLQEGVEQFDYEVLIEQMEILNQILYLNGSWDNIKGYMNTVTNIVEWLNLQLESAHANNVTLVELITHHATALQNLYYILGDDLFPQLITALVDPQQAMTLKSHNDIETVICDADSFSELLKPTVYHNTTSLQGLLCSLLMSGHPTIANDLMTHFNIAPLEHEIIVLATNNQGKGFQDQNIDMRNMINELQKLSNVPLVILVNGMMTKVGYNTTMLPNLDNTDGVITMISEALTTTLPTIPQWNEIIYPILGRLDLAMIMVDDLFFTLPDREAEIQAVLSNDTIVNAALPVIMSELPNVIRAWNDVMEQPTQVSVLSKLILELLKGSLEGTSEDASYLIGLLNPVNSTMESTDSLVDLFVSLDRILLTDFGQQLMDVFRIRQNAERLEIITDLDSKDLLPFDAAFVIRTQEFVEKAVACSMRSDGCIIKFNAPATFELLAILAEVASQLPTGSLESLEDMFTIFAPILEEFLQQTVNGSSELEQSLNMAFSFLKTVFESNKVRPIDVLSIFEFESALLNSSIVYQFLRENTDLTEVDLMALRNGSINTTVLFELFDLGVDDSINLLCNKALIDDLLVNVNPDLKAEIIQGVCSNGTLIAVDFLRTNINLKTVIELVTKTAGQTFPEFLLEILDAIGNVPDIDYEAFQEFVAIVVPPLFENGFPSISDLGPLAENINITRRALRSVDALMTIVEDLFVEAFPNYDDVQRLVRTLLDNLYIFELLAEIPDLTVSNVLKNEEVLEDYLFKNTELARREARDITYASFNLEQLFLAEVTGYLDMLCDPDYLSTILILPNQTNAIILADTMCGLSGNDIAILIETALPFVDVNAILNVSYMADSFGGAFTISNATIMQVMQSIASLETVTMALPALQQALSSFDDDPAVEKLRELAELGFFTAEEISGVTQEIVCGSTNLRKRRDVDDKIRRYERDVISENNDDFCQDIFSSIVDGVDGRLVWAYLKPIVEGSILFSPDIPPVRRIIEKANRTFENIALTQRFADVWLTSGGDLGTLLDPDALEATKTLLENSYVQGLLKDQYGISSDQFTDILNGNLTSMPPGQVQTLNLLAELVSNLTRCFNLNRFVGYANEDSMVQAARSLDEENTLLAALVFDIPGDATELPAHIKYKIRMDTDNTPPTDRLRDRFLTRSAAHDFVFDFRYLRGYIMLQDMVEGSIVSLQASPDLQPPGVYLQLTPYPCFLNDQFASIFTLILPLVMTICFVVLIGAMTHQLVYEKERGIEELMKVMGLPGGANWWAWFISNSLILILLSCVVVIVLKFGNILPMTDWSLLLVFILDYFFSIIMFCYLASAVFQRASIASLASILVYLLFYLPYLAVFASQSLLDVLWKPILMSLFCPSTFSVGCVLVSEFEVLGTGAQWDLVWHNPLQEDVTNMAFVLIALAVDGAIYLILGWYIRMLFPGKYGVPRSWYFPLQPSFWFHCSISRKRDMTQYINSAHDAEAGVTLTDQGSVVEEEPSNHPIGIAILNLTKVYRSCFKMEKVAIDNLTLNFFEGQVTAVLGHNGAGKTTTINIITGLFPATSGKVFLQGVNVAKKVSAARENLGVCVQHNALYDNLTVREHMAMAGRVKGLTGKELDDDIFTLLEDVGLLKKSEEKVKNLSGGMKRKLSVAVAFVGHSKIVVLDEPTSGVDPHARRAIWNLIMKHKTGRTIVLCTHFMDEADILGDRIAILDRGHLRCCGSPAFLKSRFSSGYRLSLSKEMTSGAGTPTNQSEEDYKTKAEPNIYDTMKSASSDIPSTSSGIATDLGSVCDANQVTDFIQARIPSAMLQDDIGSELVYTLPVENGEREKFQELFQDLDNSLEDLRIKSYGISDTTLKEVFLKVSTSRSVDGEAAILRNNNWSLRKPSETFTIASGISRALLNAWGILMKRLHFVRRDWQGLIWTVLMPVVLVALAIGFSQLNQITREYQRQLTPAMFNPNSFVFFSDESESDMGQRLTDALINPPGLGTTCMADADQMDLYPCIESNSHTVDQLANFDLASLSEVPEGQCTCTDTGFGQECLPGAGGIPPPTWITDTLVYLQNISMKEDKDRYLLDTQMTFRNSRFGGVSWFDVMESNETQVKAWFNNRAYHAMPTFLNVMNNIILRATVTNNSHEYGITAYNHPLELSKQDLGVDIWLEAAKTFGIVVVIVTALVLIPSAFSMFLVTENINGSKRLHHISGVGTLTYWLTNLLWDMLSFCIPIGLMLVILYIFNYRGLILASNVGAFVALAFLYGFAIMSQIYIFIPFFKESGSAFIFIFCVLLFEAIISNLPNWLIAVDAVSETETRVFEILNYVLLVFSPYCLSSGVLSLIQNQAMADIYRAFGVDEGIYEQPFQILKWHLVALAVEGVVAFVILLIVDAVRNSNCSSCLDPNADDPSSYHGNEDVMEEKELVLGGGESDKDALVLKELRKVYRGPGRQKIIAVNDLCLGVSKGECFGLLGVNGAGKTSTFRMIVGDLSPTEGNIKTRAKSIGYCPQENAMYPQLTGEELLYCYARMKGIPSSGMSKAVAEICEELGMERYVRRRISKYSGGMKRSLAVAVALLGKPELILMDEPTTGMDPITKQRVLTSIVNVIRDNRSVILTSHSMEECEAVCTRLAIMVNGQFCCLGSPQHVKNRHGHGYSLVVRGQKTAKTDMTLITEFVHRSFPGAELKEHHHNVLRFQLPPQNITVATIFGIMEREKTSLNLEDYSVSQTTLDEVFVNFAKKQTDGLQDETSSTGSAQEFSVFNRAFEPDDDLDVDVLPMNTRSAATQL